MDKLQQALVNGGFQPSKKTKAALKQLIDDVIDPITKPAKPRTLQVQRAGSHFKARFAGRADYTFGTSPQEAEQKLRSGRLQHNQR